jgi:hypothetical protein
VRKFYIMVEHTSATSDGLSIIGMSRIDSSGESTASEDAPGVVEGNTCC